MHWHATNEADLGLHLDKLMRERVSGANEVVGPRELPSLCPFPGTGSSGRSHSKYQLRSRI